MVVFHVSTFILQLHTAGGYDYGIDGCVAHQDTLSLRGAEGDVAIPYGDAKMLQLPLKTPQNP